MTRIKISKETTMTQVLGLLLLVGTTTATAAFVNGREEGSIPTFSFAELRGLTESNGRSDDFRQALSTNGLLAIQLDDGEGTDLFGYPNDRRIALDGLCSCVDHPGFLKLDQTHELTLMDSSTARTSVATATVGLDHPLPLPEGIEETCGETVLDAMEGLRDVVASVSRAFVSALDSSLMEYNSDETPSTTLLRDEFGRSYESVADIVKSANHLEHFHVYTNNEAENSSTFSEATTAWDWHTDAGLFLVFVPAWDCNGGESSNSNVDESFYYRDTEGRTVRAKFDGSRTAIVMLGQGAQDWLNLPEQFTNHQQQSQKKKASLLKATTHSVRWSSDVQQQQPIQDKISKQRRAWYGMMNLVPESALIYGGKTLREVKQSLSLYHQHKADYQLSSEITSSAAGVPLGCGNVPAPSQAELSEGVQFELEDAQMTTGRRRHLKMQDASICNNVTNFFCWMTCMDIPEIDEASLYLEAGYSLYCVDEPILRTTNKLATAADACVNIHNSGCKGVWERTVSDENVEAAEINILAIESGDSKDLEYPFCYSGTTMYMEGFQWIQSSTCVILLFPSWVLNTAWKYVLAVIGTTLLAIGLEKFIQQRRKAMACMEVGNRRLLASAAFYGVQLTIGYALMLIIMIYSGILFFSVILGLVVGHILFNARDAIWPIHDTSHLSKDKATENNAEETNSDNNLRVVLPRGSNSGRVSSSETEEERALQEGSTHCQEFESDTEGQEYYGSLENGGIDNEKATKRKTIDQNVPEGSTPCCQLGAC